MRLVLIMFLVLIASACTNVVVRNENAIPVLPSAETTPVKGTEDAADDPAIWINSSEASRSLILGTDKKNGLAIYNLDGAQVQFLARGRLNNVDIRQEIPLNERQVSLAVATNRTEKSLDIFTIMQDGTVEFTLSQALTFEDPYGICMGVDENGRAYAFVNGKSGEYQQWLLNPEEQLQPTLLGSFQLDSQPEGCVVQDTTQTLYFGEEERGIWKMPADATRFSEAILIDTIDNKTLVADVEGMDIYLTNEKALLVVSSQGNFSYVIYDITETNSSNMDATYIAAINIVDNPALGIDGAQETDGLAVTSANLGGIYSSGLLVVQDGFNELPRENQNFKLVPWANIIEALEKASQ